MLKIISGDIIENAKRYQVEAIVNPNNKFMDYGCGVCGAISFSLGVASAVPSGGVFVIPAMSNPIGALFALLAGTCVTAILLVLIKKPRTAADEVQEEEVEEEMDLSDIKIS